MTDNPRAFFIDNEFINPKSVIIIFRESDIYGMDGEDSFLISKKYSSDSRQYNNMHQQVFEYAEVKNISILSV